MLDCETPIGKMFINEQYNTQKILESRGYTFINTAKKDSGIDAIISKTIDGILTVCGVAEIKNRKMAGDKKLTTMYLKNNGGYLITHDKLKVGQEASIVFEVPFYLIVNLLEEGVILIWKITDDVGMFTFPFDTRESTTQMTCNGGKINRVNSYLPVDKAIKIDYKH
jgi:hypothetical protein